MKNIRQIRQGQFITIVMTFIFTFACMSNSFGITVSNLKAVYHNGQVFLTWTNSNLTNLQYNVYRSTSQFTSSNQLSTAKFLGFVRDNSGKNIHLSQLEQQDVYFKIDNTGGPLASNQGLYVVTCTDNQFYYYAVTITDLSSGTESKNLILGKNSLSIPVNETVAQPLPVFQDSLITLSDEVKKWYVQFVNNQETSLYPAMNSTGSYGFNFYLSKRGTASNYPLVVVFEGQGGTGISGVSLDGSVTNCYVLGVYDWLPIPNSGGGIGVGDNTYFCCYHQSFDIYANNGSTPVSGIVKTYVQKRIIQAIHWAKNTLPIDPTRVYTKGVSATGFGALLTSVLYPDEIAAAYTVVEPMFIKPVGGQGDLYRQMWGATSSNLSSDAPDPTTTLPLPVYTILDIRKMVDVDEQTGLPLIFDVHGKKDKTVAWSPFIINWYDSLQSNHVGGVFYWDQRNHAGDGKNFLSEETTPDFFRYQTTKSYPAFTHCSINQNPGNGAPSSGAPYGAINGYLDWEDDISDNLCDYTINVMVKDFYVGGVLDPVQYETCTTDLTLRRLQNFHPQVGQTIKWKNYDVSNAKIQNGSITYSGGLITLNGIIVNKSGNRIELKISNCQRDGNEISNSEEQTYFTRSGNGYLAHVDVNNDGILLMKIYDTMGRIIDQKNVTVFAGTNTFEISTGQSGIFLVELKGVSFSHIEKLLF